VALTSVLRSAYYQLVLTQVLLWAMLSVAWNLLSGYSGYFSFGHAVFWGLGAYAAAITAKSMGLGREPTLPERMSLTRTVPAALPSLSHSSGPCVPSSAVK